MIMNNVQIYLQVTSLADITTGDGKYARKTILEAQHQDDRQILLDWGIQHPSNSYLNIWKKSIRALTSGTNGKLFVTLGNWINKPSWIEEWRWINSTAILEKKVPNGWNLYTSIISPNGLRSNKYSYLENVSDIQDNQAKAIVSSLGIDLVQFEGSAKIDSYETLSSNNRNCR